MEKEKNPFLREFHACPRCGRLIGSTKVSYFVCPKAKMLALAEKDRIG